VGVDEGVGVLSAAAAGGAAADGVEEGAGDGLGVLPLPLPAPLPEGTPGDETRSTSCAPAVIGPEVCAGQLPGGFRGVF